MDDDLREARRLADILKRMRARGGTLESTVGAEPLKPEQVKEALRKELAGGAAPLESAEVTIAAADVMAAADRAAAKVERGDEGALTDFEFSALEAIVHVIGRPAVRYTDGRIQTLNEEGDNSRWSTLIVTARAKIDSISASVGRVAIAGPGIPDQMVGTAWRLGDDLVVTNRHVAAFLVPDKALSASEWKLDAAREFVVDFNATNDAKKSARFPILELVYCAPEADVDLAILRLNAGGSTLPRALALEWDPKAVGQTDDGVFTGQEIYIIGHPYKPFGGDAVRSVFGKADGYKRWSPGLVTALSSPRPVFEHDCSTLGGNSGSAVLAASGHAVVGLHYAGLNVQGDMGRANAALALSQLGAHPVVQILRQGHA